MLIKGILPTYQLSMENDVFRQEYKKLTSANNKRVLDIKIKAQELYDLFDQVDTDQVAASFLPVARGIFQAKTALESSVMWAIKGITSPDFNPEEASEEAA